MRAIPVALLLLSALSGCALSHEIGVDAAIDAPASSRVLMPCAGPGMSGTSRDCGWTSGGPVACRPGATISVGCAANCMIGSCTGDSMLRICDSAPCTATQALAANDDACGSVCSLVEGVTCPRSGQIFVLTAPFSAGSPYTCNFVVR